MHSGSAVGAESSSRAPSSRSPLSGRWRHIVGRPHRRAPCRSGIHVRCGVQRRLQQCLLQGCLDHCRGDLAELTALADTDEVIRLRLLRTTRFRSCNGGRTWAYRLSPSMAVGSGRGHASRDRERYGLSVEQAGRHPGVSPVAYGKLEDGARWPSWETYDRIGSVVPLAALVPVTRYQ